jgi:hypothetical protein
MFAFHEDRAERACAMPLKLRPDQLDVLGRIQEAIRRTMQRDEAFAAGDIIEQRLLLLGRNLRRVGIDDQAIVFAERLRIEVLDRAAVG